MAKFAFDRQINYSALKITDFLGVDFQNDASEVALNRSPDALNVIASNNATIEKRPGFEILHTFAGGAKINGIHKRLERPAVVDLDIASNNNLIYVTYIHVGTQLWREEGGVYSQMEYYTPNAFDSGHNQYRYIVLANEPSLFIETQSGFYIVCGDATTGQFLNRVSWYWADVHTNWIGFVDLLTCPSWNSTYIPTTVIARAPTGGGTPYEAINILQQKRKNSFLGTAGTLIYQLDATTIDAITTDTYGLTGGGVVTAQKLNADGSFANLVETTHFTVNRSTGVVTFTTAPGVTPLTGQDNVIIKFHKTNANPASYLSKAKLFAKFGMNGSDDYLFIGNCGAQTNYDYYGRASDMYFPDTGYTRFGSDQSAIMGYSRLGDYLVIHKTSEAEEKTIYLRSASLDTDNEIIFPVKRGVAGVGAISRRSFQTLRGDPLFLSDEGIMGLTSNAVTDVQSVQNRGYYINNRLLAETGIADAVSCIYENKYMIFVNGKVYVGDSRRKFAEKDSFSESYQYEWYYWTGIDAKQVLEHQGTLYFGTSDGKLCRMRKKGEANAYLDNATVVASYWCTPVLFLGDITVKKSLKNLWLRCVQYDRSGVRIYYRADGITKFVKDKSFDIFDFTAIDFTRLDFDTSTDPEVIVTNRVERQFMSIQFKMESVNAENLGLIELVAKYKMNSAYKG